MKRLILWLALLLPFFANAQVNGTIQKTISTGTVRGNFGSNGLDTLPRVTGVFVDGYILKYHAATNKWYASPDPTYPGLQDSLTKKANRTFDNVASGAIAKSKVDTTATGLQTVSNFFPKGDTRYYTKSQADVNYIKNQYNSPQSADFWITGQGAFGGGLTVGNNSVFSGTLGVGGAISNENTPTGTINADSILVKDNATNTIRRISPTAFLTPTGSGSGLSGVVLTTGTQSIAGDKTFTDNLYMSGSSSKQFIITSSSGATEIYLDRAAVSKGEIRLNTSGVSKWSLGFEESSNDFLIRNRSTSSDAFKISNSTNAISAIGSISSTPQGTLYGTATGSVTSAQLATSLTDETGTGSAVFSASPTFTGTVTGTDGHFSGSLGIGVSPTYPLHVSKSLSNSYVTQLTNTNTTAGTSFGLFINAGTNGSDRAINVNNAANTLTLFSSFGNGDLEIGGSNATKASGTAWINPSDSRLKENVKPYSKGLKELLLINPKVWNYNKASGVKDTVTKHVSPIAQELKEVMPEMVGSYKGKLSGKETTLYNIDGSDYVMLLINAVKEQQAIIEKLNQRITLLEQK